jgi:hypothetical protein
MEAVSLVGSGHNPIHTCKRCGVPYDWRRSPSACLKMTYCGSLCEKADLGFTIDGLIAYRRGRMPGRELVAA